MARLCSQVSGQKKQGVKQGGKQVAGLNLLKFQQDGRIPEVVGLRQPLDSGST